MNPGSVTIDTVLGMGNSFTLTYHGGDTSDNLLNFTAHGGGGTGFMNLLPSTALAAIVFDNTSIIDAGDTFGALNSNNVVTGIGINGGFAAALLVDAFGPSSESFFLQLASTPTTATIYSVDIDLRAISSFKDILDNAISSQQVRFAVAAIPEPGAAVVFGLGLLVTSAAIRRR
jgi:hypothetical protein